MGNSMGASADPGGGGGEGGGVASALCPKTTPGGGPEERAKLSVIREEEFEEPMPSRNAFVAAMSTVMGTSTSQATEPAFGPAGAGVVDARRREASFQSQASNPLASMVSDSLFSTWASVDPFTTISAASKRREAAADAFKSSSSVASRRRPPVEPQEAGPMSSLASALSSAFVSASADQLAARGAPGSTHRSGMSSGRGVASVGSAPPHLNSQASAAYYGNLGGGLFSSKTTMAQALTQQQGAYFMQDGLQEIEVEDGGGAWCCPGRSH